MIHDSTVDSREVEFYRNLAAFWWDQSGPFWPLHTLNRLRVEWIQQQLAGHFGRPKTPVRPLQGLRILDIGCGGGILAESMARLGGEVTGIDVVEKNIHIAALHAGQQNLNIDYRTVTAESLAQSGAQYDVVLNMEVVEHVADLPAFMASCNRLVRPGGMMFVATINRTPLSWLFAIVGAEYVLRWLPRGTHRWNEFRKPGQMKKLLAAGGLDVAAESGVAVNPLTRKFSLSRQMAVNYMLAAGRKL
ncbi:MAG: bifunctional 2-polyprenyl-6-hydroxyphenol methylase/3-demethylubiquinol 3-O-methyltransferase UbiG [Gammaproteobacteria bacterium]|nr:bifunctional 2-polyprenyl-6-hydroxyphenol methylase/3-demethylubiquinol 3-O-methyltransferase UbiG [Gammaproteobacteria bacterium]